MKKAMITLMSVLWLAVPIGIASATSITCGSGSVCTEDLTHSNVANLNGNIDIRVTIDNTGNLKINGSNTKWAGTVLTLDYISSGVTDTPLGIDMFGFTGNTGVGSCATGWPPPPKGSGCNLGGKNMDGFGYFNQFEKNSASHDLYHITFGLNGYKTSFSDNTHHSIFAVHIRYNDCSGFVSDGTTTSGGGAGCSKTSVPEPSSLLLLGTSLIGLALVTRHRRFKSLNK